VIKRGINIREMWGRCLVDRNLQLSGGVGVERVQDFAAVAWGGGGGGSAVEPSARFCGRGERGGEQKKTHLVF